MEYKDEWKAETRIYPYTVWAIDGKGREHQVAELNTMSDNSERANAHLIAAAPKLYKSLVKVRDNSILQKEENGFYILRLDYASWQDACKAIAKAEEK